MANCGQLTWKAKNVESLIRPTDSQELWDFAKAWIQRFSEADENNVSEKLIYLWVTVNAWASKSVPDLTRNHEDAYLVHCMAKDHALSGRFRNLYLNSVEFHEAVNSFLSLAPVFQALWLSNNNVEQWNIEHDRREFVDMVAELDPYIVSVKNDKESRFAAFSPACALEHFQVGESIPVDWPHLLSMIYQVRCNLFHGGKSYNRASDRRFVELSCNILWEVWKDELPQILFKDRLSWDRILIRSGFVASILDDTHISLAGEAVKNLEYLHKIVMFGHFGIVEGRIFTPALPKVEEYKWIHAVGSCHGGAECGESDDLSIMDPHVSGLVRWLNVVGIRTTFSCDGHGRGVRLECADVINARIAAYILSFSGYPFVSRGRHVVNPRDHPPALSPETRDGLLYLRDIAEWIYSNEPRLSSVAKLLMDIPPLPRLHRDGRRGVGRQIRD